MEWSESWRQNTVLRVALLPPTAFPAAESHGYVVDECANFVACPESGGDVAHSELVRCHGLACGAPLLEGDVETRHSSKGKEKATFACPLPNLDV